MLVVGQSGQTNEIAYLGGLCVHCHRSFLAQVNPNEEDRTTPPSLLPRSIALVRLELSGSKVASTTKEHVFLFVQTQLRFDLGKGAISHQPVFK